MTRFSSRMTKKRSAITTRQIVLYCFPVCLFVIWCLYTVRPFLQDGIFSRSSGNHQSLHTSTAAFPCPPTPISQLIYGIDHLMESQDEEDKRLVECWFRNLCGGTYIEMGGLDGVRFSNSHVFNKAFGWKGLMVEPSPDSLEKLKLNRPNELATVNAAVCGERSVVHYYYLARFPAVSGVWEFAADSFRKKWWPNITIEQTTPIDCMPLGDILKQHVPRQGYFDFFSLDVEGAELEVLQSVDLGKIRFGVIFSEADEHNQTKNEAVRALLEKNNYVLAETYRRSDFFVNREFGKIYSHVELQRENDCPDIPV